MKHLLIYITLIFFSATGYSQTDFVNKREFHIKKVLKNDPSKTQKIWMKCTPADIKKLNDNIGVFKNLKEIVIVGGDETDDWTGLMESMSKIASLTKVSFTDNSFGEIPSSTVLLKNVSSIAFYGSPQVQFDSCTTTLSYLPNLKELNFDLFWVDEIPQDLASVTNLQSVSFNFLSDLSGNESDTVIYKDTIIAISGYGNITSLKLSAAENSLMPDDIDTIIAHFPGAIYQKRPQALEPDTFISAGKNDFTYEPQYNFIHPPVKEMNLAKEKMTIKTDTTSLIYFSSGTSIQIPENAFVDEKGNAVKGEVRIDYREYSDPLDFVFSGIPMSFDSSGQVVSQFISAGMFEMNASSNGKEVFLKKGSKISVNLASTDSTPDYDLYSFNDSTGNWDKKTDTIKVITSGSDISGALREFWSRNKPLTSRHDSTTLNERFESMDYFYTRKIKKKDLSKEKWVTRNFRIFVKKNNALVKITNTRSKKEGVVFMISRTSYNVLPEVATYQNTSWVLKDNISYKQFRKYTSNNNRFFDIRIKKESDNYTIRLKGRNGFKEFSALPVTINAENKIVEQKGKQLSRTYKRYQKMLSTREKIFNRDLKRKKKGIDRAKIRLQNYSWQKAKSSMTKTEKKMNLGTWLAYADSAKRILDLGSASTNGVIRSFSIDGFGIWNCDRLNNIENRVNIFVQYKNKENKTLNPTTTYIINKKANGILTFDSQKSIAISKTSENAMITFSKNGEMAVSLPENFTDQEFHNARKYPFVMTEIDAKSTSIGDLKKMIGF